MPNSPFKSFIRFFISTITGGIFIPAPQKAESHIYIWIIKAYIKTEPASLPPRREKEDRYKIFILYRFYSLFYHLHIHHRTFKSFLYTSVRNLAFDRMEKKDPLRHATDLKSSDKAWEEYDTLEEEVLARVKNEIDKLPERSRQIMQCIYLQGLHYKETAAKLGISIATVNTLLVNALKKIRQAYPDITQNIILFLLLSDKKR